MNARLDLLAPPPEPEPTALFDAGCCARYRAGADAPPAPVVELVDWAERGLLALGRIAFAAVRGASISRG